MTRPTSLCRNTARLPALVSLGGAGVNGAWMPLRQTTSGALMGR